MINNITTLTLLPKDLTKRLNILKNLFPNVSDDTLLAVSKSENIKFTLNQPNLSGDFLITSGGNSSLLSTNHSYQCYTTLCPYDKTIMADSIVILYGINDPQIPNNSCFLRGIVIKNGDPLYSNFLKFERDNTIDSIIQS